MTTIRRVLTSREEEYRGTFHDGTLKDQVIEYAQVAKMAVLAFRGNSMIMQGGSMRLQKKSMSV